METSLRSRRNPVAESIRQIDVAAISRVVDLRVLREQLAHDVERFWGGSLRRLGGPAGDPACVTELVDWLVTQATAYAKDSPITRTDDWRAVADARSALYASAASIVETYLSEHDLP